MSPREAEDAPPQPRQLPDVETPLYGRPAHEAWMLEAFMQMQRTLGELNASVANLKTASDKQSGKLERIEKIIYAATVVVIIATAVGGFFANKLWNVMVRMLLSAHG
jgi:predicted esterase YcpF (UPF0227 family)